MWRWLLAIYGAALAALALPAVGAGAAYRDDAAVRARLLAIPGVETALAAEQDRRAAVLVNRWLAPRIPAASDASVIVPTYGSPAYEVLDAFATRDRGVFCDGAADALAAALRLLDVAAFRLDFGYAEGGLTHTTVVVAAGSRYWLIDPTFGLELRDRRDRPLDLVRAWRTTADRSRHAVTMRLTDLSKRPMVGLRPNAVCADHPARWTMCALPTYLRAFAPALRDAGYPTGTYGLLMLSLRSPLIGPDVYGVPQQLQDARARIVRQLSSSSRSAAT